MVVSTGDISSEVGRPTIAPQDCTTSKQIEKGVMKVSDFSRTVVELSIEEILLLSNVTLNTSPYISDLYLTHLLGITYSPVMRQAN